MSDAASGITLQRRYLDSKGEAVTTAKLGDVITVELAVQASSEISNVVLVDLLPGGFEPVLKNDQSQPPGWPDSLRTPRRQRHLLH